MRERKEGTQLNGLGRHFTTPAVKSGVASSRLFSFRIPGLAGVVAGSVCAAMVKLRGKRGQAEARQLFDGGRFALRWSFIPLVVCQAHFGDKRLHGPLDLESVNEQE